MSTGPSDAMARTVIRSFILAACVLLASCAVAPDGPVAISADRSVQKVCPAARISGTLVADDEWGLTLANPGTGRHGATWPYGYSARRESGMVELMDDRGQVIAREGDHIHAGGASDDDGTAHVCFGITVDHPAAT